MVKIIQFLFHAESKIIKINEIIIFCYNNFIKLTGPVVDL
jgi:hypothetical protein